MKTQLKIFMTGVMTLAIASGCSNVTQREIAIAEALQDNLDKEIRCEEPMVTIDRIICVAKGETNVFGEH